MPPAAPRLAPAAVLVASLAFGCTSGHLPEVPSSLSAPRDTPADRSTIRWPAEGQASIAIGGHVLSSPDQRPVPIASVAKVMTAYLAVRRLSPSARLVVDADAVAGTQRRRARGESVVEVVQGEHLTRHQALLALLLPSANNVAAMLAERIEGNRADFVSLMNQTARELGMTDTTYTDPSGFDAGTVSTARDQLLMLRAALRSPELAQVMGMSSAVLPVVGRVRSTNSLLGSAGFIAGKTGSTSAAGGCLAFRVVRGGRVMDGVVLGQRGGPLIASALRGAVDLADQGFSA